MRRRISVGALFVLAIAAAAGRPWAKKTVPGPISLDYQAGDSWSIEDTLRARIPDPQTGNALTPTTRGIFRYRVEKVLSDGSVVVVARVVSLRAGSSLASLNPIPVEHPGHPERVLLMGKDGSVYGLYGDEARKRGVSASGGLAAWLAVKPQQPWFWYKVPLEEIKVGAQSSRRLGDETWSIRRQDDEVVDGAPCAVYEAKLDQDAVKVVETTWLSREEGRPIRREIVEKRARNVSSTLTQVRL